MKVRFSILLIFLIQLCVAQKTYVFFGSYNWDKEKPGIYVYNLDTISGHLDAVSTLNGVKNPSFLTLSPDGKTLYSVTDSKTPNAGSVSSFGFSPKTGTLTLTSTQPSLGENPVYVAIHPSGKYLACANYTQAGLTLYPINRDATIAKPLQHIDYTNGSGVNAKRQEVAHAHCAVFSSDGKQLMVTDLGNDRIWNYSFDPNRKEPASGTKFTETKTPPGSGPRHLVFNKKGNVLYMIEELGGAIEVLTNNNGKLTLAQRVFTHPENSNQTEFESSDVYLSPDGKFLYATNRGTENNIAIYSVGTNGRLTLLGYQSTMGLHPRTFCIDPSGKFVMICNTKSSTVTVFKRDIITGLLTFTGQEIGIENVTSAVSANY